MIQCHKCLQSPAADIIGTCVNCLRNTSSKDSFIDVHSQVRDKYGLPQFPPRCKTGIQCSFCANSCQLAEGFTGYCGLHKNKEGRLVHLFPKNAAKASMYLDLLPTNCCASWFCRGSAEPGFNLAVFLYGCNFNCLFCQNASHKNLFEAPYITQDEMVKAALENKVRCVCFFGGSPEPQLPFTLKIARRIIAESNNTKHICWEWNGCGNPKLVKKAAEIAAESGGTIKFDLKAFHPHIVQTLCGVDNKQSFENFKMLAYDVSCRKTLTATTLLVPYYVDQNEIKAIVKYIAEFDPDIPYSLLVFHPDFYLSDLPVTPRNQVDSCYSVASQYLRKVNIGNKYLI
jgi:pyruvate formate lyase activating enzyme